MEQGQALARQETVVEEEGFFDRQARVAALQLAGAIVLNTLREDQILGASGGPHRVGLEKAQARNGPRQAGGLEKAARDRVAAKLPESGGFAGRQGGTAFWGHCAILSPLGAYLLCKWGVALLPASNDG